MRSTAPITRWLRSLGLLSLRRGAELCMSALALLTLADVLGRYVFHFPVPGTVELTEILMVGVIFIGLVLTTLERGHVVVDVFTNLLNYRVHRVVRLMGLILSAVTSLILSITSWQQALSAMEFGDRSAILGISLTPVIFFMSVMLFINAGLQFWLLTIKENSQEEVS